MCDTNQAIKIFNEVCESCNHEFSTKICEAYLYGSYARGDYHSESDIDILLTVADNPEALSDYRKIASNICSDLGLKYDIMISAIIKSNDQFHQYANVLPFYQNVIAEGIRYAAN